MSSATRVSVCETRRLDLATLPSSTRAQTFRNDAETVLGKLPQRACEAVRREVWGTLQRLPRFLFGGGGGSGGASGEEAGRQHGNHRGATKEEEQDAKKRRTEEQKKRRG